MTHTYMTGYLCLLPFNFKDPAYLELDTLVLDYGMGLDADYLFQSALGIMFDITSIDDVLNYLDDTVFPEHVPNDSLSACIGLCIGFINYVLSKLIGFKGYLNLMVTRLNKVTLDQRTSTIYMKFNID